MDQDGPIETVTKLEAAERQLRVAIRMFFERKDMLAVHTLASASLQILDDLAVKRGISKRMYGEMYKLPPEERKMMVTSFREAQGFLKHADKDPPEKVLKFRPEMTKFFLFEAARLAYEMLGRMAPECGALITWFTVACPYVFEIDDAPHLQIEAESLSKTLKPDDFEYVLYMMDHPSLINCEK